MRVRVRVQSRPRPRFGMFHRDESGAIVAVVVIALMAMMGMVVLVVDVGGLLNLRRRLVLSADSAALAAAQSCALNDAASAPTQADLLAESNQSDASRTSYETVGCGTEASGSVEVRYESPKELVFAPLLGAPESAPVGATASAIWGPTGGLTPMPIELSVDPNGEVPCALQDVGTVCAYWHDNSADHDLTSSSNWGFMNLASAGVAAGDSCPNAGANDRAEWINDTQRGPVAIGPDGYTYVCVDSGHAASNWYEALLAQVGQVKYFPVNDPDRMIRTPGKEKYAVIGFVGLRIDEVLKGNDPEAIGSPGSSGNCTGTHSFTLNEQFDLDGLGCYATPPESVSNLVLSKKVGNRTTVYREGTDYTFDAVSHVVTWFTAPTANVKVDFEWANAGTPGKCGSHISDPNAVCLVTSWQGVRVAGSLPGNGQDFGLRAVRLDG